MKKLLENKKFVWGLTSVFILGILYSGAKIYENTTGKKILTFGNKGGSGEEEEKEESGQSGEGRLTVITNEEANRIADVLFEAMDGFGTNIQKITKEISNIKNKESFDKVYNAFGIKPYAVTGTPTWVTKPLSQDKDLIEWLSAELDAPQKIYMRSYLSNWGYTLN